MSSSGKRIRERRQRKDAFLISKKNLVPLVAIGGGVIALIVAAVVLLGGGSGGGTPVVSVEQERFDFGDVLMNTPITTVFVVNNTGNGVLKILGQPEVVVKAGC